MSETELTQCRVTADPTEMASERLVSTLPRLRLDRSPARDRGMLMLPAGPHPPCLHLTPQTDIDGSALLLIWERALKEKKSFEKKTFQKLTNLLEFLLNCTTALTRSRRLLSTNRARQEKKNLYEDIRCRIRALDLLCSLCLFVAAASFNNRILTIAACSTGVCITNVVHNSSRFSP